MMIFKFVTFPGLLNNNEYTVTYQWHFTFKRKSVSVLGYPRQNLFWDHFPVFQLWFDTEIVSMRQGRVTQAYNNPEFATQKKQWYFFLQWPSKTCSFFIFKRWLVTFHHTKYFHSNTSSVIFIEWQSENITKPLSIFEHVWQPNKSLWHPWWFSSSKIFSLRFLKLKIDFSKMFLIIGRRRTGL